MPAFTSIPRLPQPRRRLIGRTVLWALAIVVTVGVFSWVFFGMQGLTLYALAMAYLLIATACGMPALLFFLTHRAKIRVRSQDDS